MSWVSNSHQSLRYIEKLTDEIADGVIEGVGTGIVHGCNSKDVESGQTMITVDGRTM